MAAKAVFAEIKSTKIKSVTANKDLTFRYTKEIVDDNSALLEFETQVDGTHINGADITSWPQAERITEFKVMVRPLRAVSMLHGMMQTMLEQMNYGQYGTTHFACPNGYQSNFKHSYLHQTYLSRTTLRGQQDRVAKIKSGDDFSVTYPLYTSKGIYATKP